MDGLYYKRDFMPNGDTKLVLAAGIVVFGMIFGLIFLLQYLTKPSFTEFTRDEKGRIIQIVERRI